MGTEGSQVRFPSTVLPQSADPKEAQRTTLDLLDKINRVAGSLSGIVTVTYSPTVTLDASKGATFILTVTDTNAWTMAEPVHPTSGQRITIMLRGQYGGSAGTVTWASVFLKAAFTMPSDGYSRSIDFLYNGSSWVELSKTASDIPN